MSMDLQRGLNAKTHDMRRRLSLCGEQCVRIRETCQSRHSHSLDPSRHALIQLAFFPSSSCRQNTIRACPLGE